MNYPLVLIPLVLIIVLALAAALVFRVRKSSSSPESSQPVLDMGAVGELYVKDALQTLAGHKQFVSNCYVPKYSPKSDEMTYTEIDLILLHESGIYVIESKNYSGWIFGSEGDKNWTQSLSGRGKKRTYSFYNPIKQNKVHLNCLKKYLDLDGRPPCYSFVVFSDRCELKKIELTSGEHFVVNRRDLFQAVQKNAEAAGKRLTREEIDTLYRRLYPLTQVSEEQKALHAEQVRQAQQVRQARQKQPAAPAPAPKPEPAPKPAPAAPEKPLHPEEERICPRCGGKLVIRTAQKGERAGKQFWGCSNHPKCWFIENIEEETTVTL